MNKSQKQIISNKALTRSFLKPIIIPHSLKRQKYPRRTAQDSMDEERKAVEKLPDLDKGENNLETVNSISEAKQAMTKRIEGEDLVEEIKFKRRFKSNLPSSSSQKLLPVIKSIKQRQQRKIAEENFRERCRYHRIYEDDLNSTSIELYCKIKTIKDKIDRYREELVVVKKKLVDFCDELDKIKENLSNFESKGRSKTNQEDLAIWLSTREDLRDQIRRKESLKNDMQLYVKNETEAISDTLTQLEKEKKELKHKVSIVKSSQINHYFSLLKEGKDCKNEGLQWIVKKLWGLGQTINLTDFPVFLDEDAVRFILFTAQKKLEVDEILNKAIDPRKNSASFTQKSLDRWNNIKERLSDLTKNFSMKKPEYSYCPKSKKLSIRWIPLEKLNDSLMIDRLTEPNKFYESYVTRINETIKNSTENEIQRLVYECSLHGYEERYKISIRDLISAVSGTESPEKYLVTLLKHQSLHSNYQEGRSFSLNR